LGICCLWWCLAPVQARTFPEFSAIAEKQAAVVVNINALRPPQTARTPFLEPSRPLDLPPWLRRLLPQGQQRDETEEPDDRAVGSGFVVSADGYILTNAHVVEGASEILVRFSDRREVLARLVGADARSDVALLKVEARGLSVARMGDPASLRVGDWVLAIGSPFGFDSTVTAGIVSAKDRALPDETLVPFIQTDVAINPGNSGGPLFNLAGEVVGINSQIYSRTGGFMGMSFAIPIDVAMDVQAQLREQGRVRRGRIGVLIQEVTQDIAESFGLREAKGALVGELEPDSPAALAGVRVGDVLLRFNGQSIPGSLALPRMVGAVRPGRTAELELWRAGQLLRMPLVVAEFPEATTPALARQVPLPRGANALGMVLGSLSGEQRSELGLAQGGAVIRELAGAAARAELKPGDVIVELVVQGRNHPVAGPKALEQALVALPPGSALSLRIRRGPSQSFVALRLPGG
jgi:serine protease Do